MVEFLIRDKTNHVETTAAMQPSIATLNAFCVYSQTSPLNLLDNLDCRNIEREDTSVTKTKKVGMIKPMTITNIAVIIQHG